MIDLPKYAKMIEWSLKTHPGCDIFGSLSPNQVESKLWLIEELSDVVAHVANERIEIVGSWYGYPLIDLLREELFIDKIECWDIDKEARMIAAGYNRVFKSTDLVNIYGKNYWEHSRNGSEATLLINTSSEHMKESFYMMSELHKKNKFYVNDPLIVIQSNDMYHIPEHINCVESTEELIDKHKIRDVKYVGKRKIYQWEDEVLAPSNYNRFMVIGRL